MYATLKLSAKLIMWWIFQKKVWEIVHHLWSAQSIKEQVSQPVPAEQSPGPVRISAPFNPPFDIIE